jgi:hypothetical protein
MRWEGHGIDQKCEVSFAKAESKRQLWRNKHGWENNIKMVLVEIWCEDVN